jgi:hypothetical protein
METEKEKKVIELMKEKGITEHQAHELLYYLTRLVIDARIHGQDIEILDREGNRHLLWDRNVLE